MAAPIIVRGLGLGGVNLVKSPLEMDDNELVQAQNAEPYRERGVAGVRKRAALRPVNASALSAIEGIVPAELTPSGAGDVVDGPGRNGVAGTVYVLYGTTWKYTVDGGVNWADALAAILGGFTYGSATLGPAPTSVYRADGYRPATGGFGTYTDGTISGGGGNAGTVLGQDVSSEPTDHIEISTVNNKRSIQLSASTRTHTAHNASDTHGTVFSVSLSAFLYKVVGGFSDTVTVQLFVRISGTDYDIGAAQTLGEAWAQAQITVSTLVSPATSIAWTVSEIESAEFGVRIVTNPNAATVHLFGISVGVVVPIISGGL